MTAKIGDKHPKMKGNKYAAGNDGGAPTKYDPKYCQEMIDYFNVAPNWYDSESKKLIPNELPTLYKFARRIGVSKLTLLNWSAAYKEFFNALEACKEAYKEFLIVNGLVGLYNSSFAIFVAKNTTDMRDKVETEHSGEIKFTPIYGGKSISGYDSNQENIPTAKED